MVPRTFHLLFPTWIFSYTIGKKPGLFWFRILYYDLKFWILAKQSSLSFLISSVRSYFFGAISSTFSSITVRSTNLRGLNWLVSIYIDFLLLLLSQISQIQGKLRQIFFSILKEETIRPIFFCLAMQVQVTYFVSFLKLKPTLAETENWPQGVMSYLKLRGQPNYWQRYVSQVGGELCSFKYPMTFMECKSSPHSVSFLMTEGLFQLKLLAVDQPSIELPKCYIKSSS